MKIHGYMIIHEKAPRITCKDKSSTLEKDNSVSIHHRNVQKLTIETYKALHGFSPPILNDIFVLVSCPYNFCQNDTLQRRRVNSIRHDTESISFLGPKIWDLVPSDIKRKSIFKRKIFKWVPLQCSCQLCKIYLQHHVGSIQGTPKNSLHRNGGIPLNVFLSMCEQMCVCLPVCSHWFEKSLWKRLHLLFSDRVDIN